MVLFWSTSDQKRLALLARTEGRWGGIIRLPSYASFQSDLTCVSSSKRCLLSIAWFAVDVYLSFTDFERRLRPCLKVFTFMLFVWARLGGELAERFLGVYEAEVIIAACFTSFRFGAICCKLEATESFVSHDLSWFVLLIFNCSFFKLEWGITWCGGELVIWLSTVWEALWYLKNIFVSDAHSSKVGHVVVAVDFFERSVLMSEMTPFAIWAELFSIELSAVLRFVLVIETRLSLSDPIDLS